MISAGGLCSYKKWLSSIILELVERREKLHMLHVVGGWRGFGQEVGYDSRSAALMAVTRDNFTPLSALMPVPCSGRLCPYYPDICVRPRYRSRPPVGQGYNRGGDAYPILVEEIGYRNYRENLRIR